MRATPFDGDRGVHRDVRSQHDRVPARVGTITGRVRASSWMVARRAIVEEDGQPPFEERVMNGSEHRRLLTALSESPSGSHSVAGTIRPARRIQSAGQRSGLFSANEGFGAGGAG
jgi:hypothetical protein